MPSFDRRSRSGAFELLNGSLSPDLALLFGLSTEEFALLQDAMTRAKARIEQTVLARTMVKRDRPEVMMMEFRGSPEFGEDLGQLRATFQRVLGADGFASYETLHPGGVQQLFHSLGGRACDVTLTRSSDATSSLRVEMKYFDENGQPTGGGSSTGTLVGILPRLGPFAKLLPADF